MSFVSQIDTEFIKYFETEISDFFQKLYTKNG